MIVTFISQCEKNALKKTRRVLDAFADRIGDNTWQTVITEDGLNTVKKMLRQTATKSTAVSCHWIRSRSRSQFLWVVGNKSKFDNQGVVPENDRQGLLVSCFEGKAELSPAILDALKAEKNAEEPNYPLIRKYFRAANPHLKALILFGLHRDPTDFDLLTDLVFFHEFDRNLPELIEFFTNVCRLADDLQQFSEIAREFYSGTLANGYNAVYAPRDIFDNGSDKRKIIDFLIKEEERQGQEDISF